MSRPHSIGADFIQILHNPRRCLFDGPEQTHHAFPMTPLRPLGAVLDRMDTLLKAHALADDKREKRFDV